MISINIVCHRRFYHPFCQYSYLSFIPLLLRLPSTASTTSTSTIPTARSCHPVLRLLSTTSNHPLLCLPSIAASTNPFLRLPLLPPTSYHSRLRLPSTTPIFRFSFYHLPRHLPPTSTPTFYHHISRPFLPPHLPLPSTTKRLRLPSTTYHPSYHYAYLLPPHLPLLPPLLPLRQPSTTPSTTCTAQPTTASTFYLHIYRFYYHPFYPSLLRPLLRPAPPRIPVCSRMFINSPELLLRLSWVRICHKIYSLVRGDKALIAL